MTRPGALESKKPFMAFLLTQHFSQQAVDMHLPGDPSILGIKRNSQRGDDAWMVDQARKKCLQHDGPVHILGRCRKALHMKISTKNQEVPSCQG
jgi:hypothetical protein